MLCVDPLINLQEKRNDWLRDEYYCLDIFLFFVFYSNDNIENQTYTLVNKWINFDSFIVDFTFKIK